MPSSSSYMTSERCTILFDSFVNYFIQSGGTEACKAYLSNRKWTPLAKEGLIKAARAAFSEGEPASIGHRDQWERSEYFTLDVVLTDPDTWASPFFVAEHENAVDVGRLQYSAWKLLSVKAQCRILVGYFAAGTNIQTFDVFKKRIEEVCRAHSGEELLVIGGNATARPEKPEDFRNIYSFELLKA